MVKYLPDETSFGVQPPITVLRDESSYPLRVFTRANTNLNQKRRIPNSYYFYIEDRPNKIIKSDQFGTESTHLTNFPSQSFNISEGIISEGDNFRSEIQWNTKSGEKVRNCQGHAEGVTCVAVSPAGDWIVSGSLDKSLIQYDTKSGEKVRDYQGHAEGVTCVAVSLTGDWIVSGLTGDLAPDLAKELCVEPCNGTLQGTYE